MSLDAGDSGCVLFLYCLELAFLAAATQSQPDINEPFTCGVVDQQRSVDGRFLAGINDLNDSIVIHEDLEPSFANRGIAFGLMFIEVLVQAFGTGRPESLWFGDFVPVQGCPSPWLLLLSTVVG